MKRKGRATCRRSTVISDPKTQHGCSADSAGTSYTRPARSNAPVLRRQATRRRNQREGWRWGTGAMVVVVPIVIGAAARDLRADARLLTRGRENAADLGKPAGRGPFDEGPRCCAPLAVAPAGVESNALRRARRCCRTSTRMTTATHCRRPSPICEHRCVPPGPRCCSRPPSTPARCRAVQEPARLADRGRSAAVDLREARRVDLQRTPCRARRTPMPSSARCSASPWTPTIVESACVHVSITDPMIDPDGLVTDPDGRATITAALDALRRDL